MGHLTIARDTFVYFQLRFSITFFECDTKTKEYSELAETFLVRLGPGLGNGIPLE